MNDDAMNAAGAPARPDLLLVAMPWETVTMPSIRLGLLKAVCDRAGFACVARHFNVDAMEHFFQASRAPGRTPAEAVGSSDYLEASQWVVSGLGDWIFSVPPLYDSPPVETDPFLALIRASGGPGGQARLDLAIRLRAMASGFLEAKAREVAGLRPRVLGLSLSFGQTTASLALTRMVKALDPSIRVIVGGATCDGSMGVALAKAFREVDVVVRGEADRVLPGLLRDLVAGGAIARRPGLCFFQQGEWVVEPTEPLPEGDLDALPHPDFDDYFERLRKAAFRGEVADQIALPVEASRGCWWGQKHHCNFCGLNGDGIAYRSKGAQRAADEFAALARRYRVLRFQVTDNIIAPRHLRDLLPRLRDSGTDYNIFWESKANLSHAQVLGMRDAGIRTVQPGIESLSTPILALMRKGVTALQNVRLLKWCASAGVMPVWNFLYGFPGEDAAEYARLASLVPALGHLPPPSGMRRMSADRFSPYFDHPDEHGIEILGPAADYRLLLPVDAATASELACHFSYRYRDGRDPEAYVAPLRIAVDRWCADWHPTRSLVYRRGPDFLSIVDRRPAMAAATADFGPLEAAIYLACEDGADAAGIVNWFASRDIKLGEAWVQGFLDELTVRQLVFVDGGKALALALPANPEPPAAGRAEP
jgi:ribosomal peptide maturation radical SAM protein 1